MGKRTTESKKCDSHLRDKQQEHEHRKRKKKHKHKKSKEREKRDKDLVKSSMIRPDLQKVAASSSHSLSAAGPYKERVLGPAMTPAEYKKQQEAVRREYDEETGRYRLVRGSGEIIEEIVSKSQQQAINKAATQRDGAYYQHKMALSKK